MNFPKGGTDGQVNKAIDQAAGVAKEKINEMDGGKQKKDKKGGVGDKLIGAIGKVAAAHPAVKAADQALAFGKKVVG